MPADIPADVAYIGGVWSEGVLWGFHIILFGALCKILLSKAYRRGRGDSFVIMLIFSTSMFILSTTHAALALHELLQGFVYQRDIPGGPPVFFRRNVFPDRKAIYFISTILGDGLLVWRVYAVWGHNLIICIPPFLFLVGSVVGSIKTIIANVAAPTSTAFTSEILSWETPTLALIIATQVSATCLIAGRIYYISHYTAGGGHSKSRYMPIVWIVVESGAVYTSAAIVLLVTNLLHMNVEAIMELMLAQICAMVPALIVVRIALGFAYDGGSSIRPKASDGSGNGNGDGLAAFRARGFHSWQKDLDCDAADASLTLGGGLPKEQSSLLDIGRGPVNELEPRRYRGHGGEDEESVR